MDLRLAPAAGRLESVACIALLLWCGVWLGCATTTPPAQGPCLDKQTWSTTIYDARDVTVDAIVEANRDSGVTLTADQEEQLRKRLKSLVMWRFIRMLLLDGRHHNYGRLVVDGVRTRDGDPLVVHRTGVTPSPNADGSCFRWLLEEQDVRHVLNLYDGPMPTADLREAERSAAQANEADYLAVADLPGGDHSPLVSWREELRDNPDDPKVHQTAMASVAKLINTWILRPEGKAPRGHVHVHCGGGMHRTGMVLGILDRCFNGADREQVERVYKHHVAWTSPQARGGYEVENVDFVMSFDCSLLKP